jgi:hypothetical protein
MATTGTVARDRIATAAVVIVLISILVGWCILLISGAWWIVHWLVA